MTDISDKPCIFLLQDIPGKFSLPDMSGLLDRFSLPDTSGLLGRFSLPDTSELSGIFSERGRRQASDMMDNFPLFILLAHIILFY
jgi:hypothetical protein